MTPASSKTQIIWLEDRVDGLEKRLKEVERLNKPPTKPIATKLSRQWGWTLIPKPLTQAQMDAFCNSYLCYQQESPELSGIYKLIRAVEKAHGIGEKE